MGRFLSPGARWLPKFLMARFLLDVSAELEAHRGQNFGREFILAARVEPLEQRRGQYRCGCGGLDGRENGPTSFARVGNVAGEALERRLLEEGDGGQVKEPRGNDTAAAPDFRNVRKI